MNRYILFLILPIMGVLLTGCPFNLTDVRYLPAQLNPTASANVGFALAENVTLDDLPCDYTRVLRSGTTWVPVGEVPKGTVYRSKEQQLTLECSNAFQAYLVISEKKLVGFYLPVEKGYVALEKPVPLPIKP